MTEASKPVPTSRQVPTLTEVLEVGELVEPDEVVLDLSDEALAPPSATAEGAMDALDAQDLAVARLVDEALQDVTDDPQFQAALERAVQQAIRQALDTVLAEVRERLVLDLQARLAAGLDLGSRP